MALNSAKKNLTKKTRYKKFSGLTRELRPKKPTGRPRKPPVTVPLCEQVPKRRPGRPKKLPPSSLSSDLTLAPSAMRLTVSSDVVTLLDIVPECMIEPIRAIPPDLLTRSEHELRKLIYADRISTQQTDDALRQLFWLEYENAVQQGRRMYAVNIYADVIHQGAFSSLIRNASRMAWIICPPGSHTADINILLRRGNERLKEILELPIKRRLCRCNWQCICPGSKGILRKMYCHCFEGCKCPETVDAKVAELIVKIYEKVELRAKGSVPQVINQRTLLVSKNLTPPTTASQLLPAVSEDASLEEIQRKIAELEPPPAAAAVSPPLPSPTLASELLPNNSIDNIPASDYDISPKGVLDDEEARAWETEGEPG